MADFFDHITSEQADLIRQTRLFFVATADPALTPGKNGAGAVNVSPKGGVPLHVLDERRVAYLDYVGSGNETARHSLAGGPITVMVCAFEQENAAVVRLYGRADVTPLAESPHAALLMDAPADEIALPQRQATVVQRRGHEHQLRLRRAGDGVRCAAHGARPGPALQAGEEGVTPGQTPYGWASISTNAMTHGSVPRFTQLCTVARCTSTSPACRCTSTPSSSSISISPDITTA